MDTHDHAFYWYVTVLFLTLAFILGTYRTSYPSILIHLTSEQDQLLITEK
jgi:hypothetical protein